MSDLTLRWRESDARTRDEAIVLAEPVKLAGPRDAWEAFDRPDGHRGFRLRNRADLDLWRAVNPLSAALAARADLVLLVPPKPGFPDGLWGWVSRTDGSILLDVRTAEGSEARSVSMGTPSAVQTSSATSASFSYTVATGSDRLLVMPAAIQEVSNFSATYNGSALTKHAGQTILGDREVAIYRLIAPPEGAHDLVHDSAAGTTAGRRRVLLVVAAFGVDQTTPLGTAAGETGTTPTASSSVSPASAVGDRVVSAIGSRSTGTVSTADPGDATLLGQDVLVNIAGAFSHKAGEASSTTIAWTFTADDNFGHVAAAIKQAAAAAGRIFKLAGFGGGLVGPSKGLVG